MKVKIQDPVSAFTHMIGAVLAVAGLTYLLTKASSLDDSYYVWSVGVFGVSMILLYAASTIYHLIDTSNKWSGIMKHVDHMMIFVLIAGTYTPVCIIALDGLSGGIGTYILILIWACAIGGILLKLFWIGAPRWLSTGLYILMGWLVVIAFFPLYQVMPPLSLGLMFAGGVIYTLGGLIYGMKWPHFKNPWFGFHELFHLFVMGGTLCHYLMTVSLLYM